MTAGMIDATKTCSTTSWRQAVCNAVILVAFALSWVIIPASGVSAATYTWTGPGSTWDTTGSNWSAGATWVSPAEHIALFNTDGASVTVSGTVYAQSLTANDNLTLGGGLIGGRTGGLSADDFTVSVAAGKLLQFSGSLSAGGASRFLNINYGASLELASGGNITVVGAGTKPQGAGVFRQSGGSFTSVAISDFGRRTGTNAWREWEMTGGTLSATSITIGHGAADGAFVSQGRMIIDGANAVVAANGAIQLSVASDAGQATPLSKAELFIKQGDVVIGSGITANAAGGRTKAEFGSNAEGVGQAIIRVRGSTQTTIQGSLPIALIGSNVVFSTIDRGGTGRTLTISSTLTGSGGFAVTGTTNSILELNAANTHTGTTRHGNGGTLRINNVNALQNSTLDTGSSGPQSVSFNVAGPNTYNLGGLTGSDNLALGGTNTISIGANNASTTYSGTLSGVNSGISKAGTGTLTLTNAHSYTGATGISAGRLEIGAASSINTSSGITIDGGELRYNAATALTKPITFTAGTISGTGTIGTAVTVAAGDFVSPGNSPGTQAYTSLHAWAPGGTYQWELNALTGSAGTTWDLVNVTSGTFDLSALAVSPGNQFVLDLITLDALNAAGPLANPYDGGSYTFAIASYNPANFLLPTGLGLTNTAGTDLTGLFQVNLSNWQGPKPELGNVSVRINSDANGIDLVIVPEPATLMLLVTGVAVAAYGRRRRSCMFAGT